jgi:hypothetical protein
VIANAYRHAPPADLVRHRGVIHPSAPSTSPIRRLRAAAVPAPGGRRLVHDRLKLPVAARVDRLEVSATRLRPADG